jgi:RHS repeat-associated protein
MALPLSPVQAEGMGTLARRVLDSATDLLPKTKSLGRSDARIKPKQIESPGQREAQVTRVRLCPRRLLMYVGEEFKLSPLPLDNSGAPVHGVVFSWISSDSQVATVASDGIVTAGKSGQCFVTASLARKQARVRVEVRGSARPRLTNAQWDVEHGNECADPEVDPDESSDSKQGEPQFGVQLLPPPDPDEPPNVNSGGSRFNATGHPRFSPNLALQSAPGSDDNQLGSSSFHLSIPILGSGGRGVGAGLNLGYNSRMWTKNPDTSEMIFDYDQGWPGPGFRLNYGWIIRDYDVPVGSSGNYLLIEADGTRTPLIKQGATGVYRSNDGRYLQFASHILSLPNGTTVRYTLNNSRFVPVSVKDINGNSISITYVDRNAGSCSDALRVEACNCGSGCSKPARQAINYITDTLGRLITFYYYADGHLAEVRAPRYGGGTPDRVLAKFYYQTLTLSYNFSLTVSGAPGNGQVDVLRRVYFPETGRGYVFDNYSGYGMCTHASMRLAMTDGFEGTETAYTEYVFNTTGQLSDSPEFTQRKEWWLHKTDDSGNEAGPESPATYTYSRTSDSTTLTNTIAGPTGPNSVSTVMVSNNVTGAAQFGLLTEQRLEVGAAVKLKQGFFYDDPSSAQGSSGLQRNRVITTDDGSPANQTRTDFVYGQFGRLMTLLEFGFPSGGNFKKRRRTEYTYLDTSAYIAASFYHLVTDIKVWDPNGTPNDDSDDVKVARTGFEYDTPDAGWEIQKYGFTPGCQTPACAVPPGYDTSFVDVTLRGLVTKALFWSDATGASDISFRHQYDIFGNEVKEEVGCCSLKSVEFRDAPVTSPGTSTMYWSVPFSATDGPTTGPNLHSQYSYDFNTSFLNSQTHPNGLVTSYAPDAAMRLRTVTYPKLATDTNLNPTLETYYANAQNNPSSTDTLEYQSKLTYFDGATQRSQISNQWTDGAGRTLRSGSATDSAQSGFDAVKRIYDDLGRLRKVTNPYNTSNSDGNTTGLPNATVYDYDGLNRVKTVTLPDGASTGSISTLYNGAIATVTDQAGRQRRSEADGLGRTIKVTEMDSSKQLTWDAAYGFDLNDNLTSVNQAGQTRTFKYDSMSRMTYAWTPEQDASINDGTGTFWSVKLTYTNFNAVQMREDARHAVTTYAYDGLNRLSQVSYTLPNPNPDSVQGTATVNITYGSTVPKNGQVEEVKHSFSPTDVPWKENYGYDGLSRVSSKTVSFDNQAYSYTTGYGYDQLDQLTQMTYPSQRVVKYGFENRARLNTVGDGSLATRYVSSIGYKPSQQLASVSLNNGINETYDYSPDRLQLTSYQVKKGANTLMSLSYSYVADRSRSGGVGTGNANTGQLMDITGTINSQSRNESYNYDQVARLAQASGFYSQRNYSYDRWGNRTGVSGGNSQTVAIQQSGGAPTNRIATVNGIPYSHDPAGDVTNDGQHSYAYDAESRLVKVDDGSTGTYSYDSANRRVKKVAGAFTTYYVWEGSKVIAEYGNAPAGSGGTRFYHPDLLSNRMITDSGGVVKGTMDNLPFGEDGGVAGESEKHRFTTYERDAENGSDYGVNRQFTQNTGRFMRPDPVQGSISDPQTFNRYAYVRNDPVNLYDPLGLYKACVHQAMTEYLAKLAGLSGNVAAKLGQFAGGQGGGADSFRYSATNPLNALAGFFGLGPSATIHFASEDRISKGKAQFAGYIASGKEKDLQRAGFLLHSIEDVHGAHQGFGLPFGHAFASLSGNDPDGVIGDQKFLGVANEVYQLLSGNSNAKLTSADITGLMNAIFQTCAAQGGAKNLTRPRRVGGGGAGGGGGGGGGFISCTLWVHIEYYVLPGGRIWITDYYYFWKCTL